MIIAVVGSRDFGDKSLVDETLFNELTRQNDVVITGGAKGVDTWVKEFCKMNATPCKIIRPINPSKKLDYLFRNVEILTLADKIIAFWNGTSKGTKFVIDYANARDKEIEVIEIGGTS